MSESKHFCARSILKNAQRVCVKAGTSVVTNENGRPSLTRLGAIAEQISELHDRGIEVIFVSSGAVGMGKRLLQKQGKMLMSFKDSMTDLGDSSGVKGAFNRSIDAKQKRNHSFLSMLNADARPHTLAEKNKFLVINYIGNAERKWC